MKKILLIINFVLLSLAFSAIQAVDISQQSTNLNVNNKVGGSQIVGLFGETLTAEPRDYVSVAFVYGINSNYDVTQNTTGDGEILTANAIAIISSNTGTAFIQSKNTVRYRTGHTMGIRFTASFTGTGSGYAGGFDTEDGVFVSANSTTLQFCYRNNSADTCETASWTDINSSAIDLTKINIYQILFGYLGVADPMLYIMEPATGKFKLVDSISTAGKMTTTHVGNPVFPIKMSTSGAMEIKTASWQGFVFGNGSEVGNRAFSFPNTLLVSGAAANQSEMTLTTTNVGTIAIFKNATTFLGKTNHVKARLIMAEFYVHIPAGNVVGEVTFQIVGNPTLSGAGSFADISTNNSVISYDHVTGTGASVTVTAGTPVLTRSLSYVGSTKGGSTVAMQIPAEDIGTVAYPSDKFAIIAKDSGGNNVKVSASFNWVEEF